MNHSRKHSLLYILFCFALTSRVVFGSEEPWYPNDVKIAGRITASRALANGVEVRSGTILIQVTALRDDILRIRAAAGGELPEDASWAVLPNARTSAIPVTNEEDSSCVGFHTAKLRVELEKSTSRLRITDLDGNLVEEDAADRPLEFHGSSFRVYRTLPAEEHFFGLGDKPGPLDRRGGAYSMWNTDQFNFQESTDT
ncbi:MAG TPA: alpha-glucosidase, partial [Edaphobacter sp.]